MERAKEHSVDYSLAIVPPTLVVFPDNSELRA